MRSSPDTTSATTKGANTPAGQVDMALKVLPSVALAEPQSEMPASSGKPAATWPTDPQSFSSGFAKRGVIG